MLRSSLRSWGSWGGGRQSRAVNRDPWPFSLALMSQVAPRPWTGGGWLTRPSPDECWRLSRDEATRERRPHPCSRRLHHGDQSETGAAARVVRVSAMVDRATKTWGPGPTRNGLRGRAADALPVPKDRPCPAAIRVDGNGSEGSQTATQAAHEPRPPVCAGRVRFASSALAAELGRRLAGERVGMDAGARRIVGADRVVERPSRVRAPHARLAGAGRRRQTLA